MGKNNKDKKSKPIYIDDGSTVADMSGVSRGGTPKSTKSSSRPRASFKEQFKTYTDAVKMMFPPMLAVLGIIALASAASWLGFAVCMLWGSGLFWAMFCGTAVAALISEILARIVRVPVLMLLVPILIPLIPGGALYYSISALVHLS